VVHLLETFIRNLIEDARYRKPQQNVCFGFLYNVVTFLTLRITERDMIKNVNCSSCKVKTILARF
jgi:hypothetical protein